MTRLECDIPASLMRRLAERAEAEERSVSSLVGEALAGHLDLPLHTLFQVSTANALVQGVYNGAITCGRLLQHGDLGLGTFEGLDGEMVVLDGTVHRVRNTGEVSPAPADAAVPFAVVTRFAPSVEEELGEVESFAALKDRCDRHRRSDNLFYAFRIAGRFSRVRTRAVGPPGGQGRLSDAAASQGEFELSDVAGVLVGIYSPPFSTTLSVPGHHFHFLSEDRTEGGHVLELTASGLRLEAEELRSFHLALPESEAFLRLDLTKDNAAELRKAES